MSKDKLSYIFFTLITFFIIIDLLIFTNIIPSSIWKPLNTIGIFAFLGISLLQRKANKPKDKIMTTLAFILVLILLIVELMIVFKLLMNK